MKIKYKFSITIVQKDFLVGWWFSTEQILTTVYKLKNENFLIIIIIIIIIKSTIRGGEQVSSTGQLSNYCGVDKVESSMFKLEKNSVFAFAFPKDLPLRVACEV